MKLEMFMNTDLSEDIADLEDLQFGTPLLMLSLINSISDNDLVEGTGVDAIDSVTAEHAVGDKSINSTGALLLDQFGSTSDGVAGVSQIVNEDRRLARNITDQHHCGILSVGNFSRPTLLVDECKLNAKRISHGRGSFGTTSIRTNDDCILVVGDVVLNVLLQHRSPVQVVDWDIEEALILRIVEIHGNDVIGTSTCEKVRNEGTSLCDPLSIAWARLEGVIRGLGRFLRAI